jgi:hypothetical protein
MNPTILAALITSSLALLGLTLGKDSKVSEFRQQWIDGLRADVAEFLSSVQHVFGFRVLSKYKKTTWILLDFPTRYFGQMNSARAFDCGWTLKSR